MLCYGLLFGTLIWIFRGPMIFWMGSYLTGRTQRIRVGDYLSETIYFLALTIVVCFSRSKPVMFQYVIGDRDLERVDVIKDLGVLLDSRMTFGNHIESIVSKSARMFGFIKRISREFNDPYTYKML
jgi:hypothetical protein